MESINCFSFEILNVMRNAQHIFKGNRVSVKLFP